MRDDVRRYFPGLCGVSEITVWQSRQVSMTNFPHVSLFTKVDDSAETAPYSVVSYGHVFAFSFHCHHQFERISPGSQHFVGSWFLQNFVSQCSVHRVSLTVPKHLYSCSTFNKGNVIEGLYPYTLFLGSKCWILPRPIYTMWIRGSQMKRLMLARGVFLDALFYYQ